MLRIRVARQMGVGERDRRTVRELVDEQPIAHEQRRNHAPRRNAKRLDEQRLDEQVNENRAGERLEVLPQPSTEWLRRLLAGTARLRDDVGFGFGFRGGFGHEGCGAVTQWKRWGSRARPTLNLVGVRARDTTGSTWWKCSGGTCATHVPPSADRRPYLMCLLTSL